MGVTQGIEGEVGEGRRVRSIRWDQIGQDRRKGAVRGKHLGSFYGMGKRGGKKYEMRMMMCMR